MYNFTLTYSICKIFGGLFSFHINMYGRSYFPGTTNQIPDKGIWRSDHAI